MMLEKFKNMPALRALALLAALLICQPSFANDRDINAPTGVEMGVDLVFGRPLLIVATAVGAAVWIIALPFSALGGNVEQSRETLIDEPARAAFMRCLGCGYNSN